MSEKNFEAIGRYVDAFEQVEKLVMKRHSLVIGIEKALKKAQIFTGSGGVAETVNRFCHKESSTLFEELVDTNVQLEIALQEVNSYAGLAGKPLIRIV